MTALVGSISFPSTFQTNVDVSGRSVTRHWVFMSNSTGQLVVKDGMLVWFNTSSYSSEDSDPSSTMVWADPKGGVFTYSDNDDEEGCSFSPSAGVLTGYVDYFNEALKKAKPLGDRVFNGQKCQAFSSPGDNAFNANMTFFFTMASTPAGIEIIETDEDDDGIALFGAVSERDQTVLVFQDFSTDTSFFPSTLPFYCPQWPTVPTEYTVVAELYTQAQPMQPPTFSGNHTIYVVSKSLKFSYQVDELANMDFTFEKNGTIYSYSSSPGFNCTCTKDAASSFFESFLFDDLLAAIYEDSNPPDEMQIDGKDVMVFQNTQQNNKVQFIEVGKYYDPSEYVRPVMFSSNPGVPFAAVEKVVEFKTSADTKYYKVPDECKDVPCTD